METAIDIPLDTLVIKGDASKLYEELAKAQEEFLPVPRLADGQVGTSRKFKYADYATIIKDLSRRRSLNCSASIVGVCLAGSAASVLALDARLPLVLPASAVRASQPREHGMGDC